MIDKYIITEEPFKGRVSVLLDGGTVAYTGGLTLAQWLEEEAHDYHKTVTPPEMEEIWNAWQEDSRTEPEDLTEERYMEMFSVLPPERYGVIAGWSCWHLMERAHAEQVDWFAQRGDRHVWWRGLDTDTDEKVFEILTKLGAEHEHHHHSKSYAPMFELTSGEVCGNAQRFATRDEAENSARARFMVWTMPTGWRVEPSSDPVTYRWDDDLGDVRI